MDGDSAMIVTGHGTAARDVLDGALVERAAAGDPEAFDALIRPRLARLFRMAMSITQDVGDAQDAVQDTCVSAWRELPRLRDHARFDAWLAQILVNSCRAHLRRRRRFQVREIDVQGLGTDEVSGPAVAGPDDVVGETEAIRRAFGRLDPATRSLLVLHYVEELPLAQIGQITNAPVGTVKWRLSNARRALAKALGAERR
jgi:RNA polymerase sigma-70 factor, ECF subfamily